MEPLPRDATISLTSCINGTPVVRYHALYDVVIRVDNRGGSHRFETPPFSTLPMPVRPPRSLLPDYVVVAPETPASAASVSNASATLNTTFTSMFTPHEIVMTHCVKSYVPYCTVQQPTTDGSRKFTTPLSLSLR